MAKKKSNGGLSLILGIVSIALAVLTFVSLAFKFIIFKTVEILGESQTESLTLQDWFKSIDSFKDADSVAGWNVGKIFMIITLVLVGLLAVALLVKIFVKNKYLNLLTKVLCALVVVCALVFFIATLVGCGALSNKLITYSANVGVYAVALLSIASAVVGFFATRKN